MLSERLRQCFWARPIHVHRHRHRRTPDNTIRYKPEIETVHQTACTNNSATETDIDAVSVAIPMFFFFFYVYARLFLHAEIPRWRTNTGNSYNFATENDIKVISVAAAMFKGMSDQLPPVSTLSDFGE